MGVHASDLGIAVRNYEGVADALQDARDAIFALAQF
jgi:hypothetical protein